MQPLLQNSDRIYLFNIRKFRKTMKKRYYWTQGRSRLLNQMVDTAYIASTDWICRGVWCVIMCVIGLGHIIKARMNSCDTILNFGKIMNFVYLENEDLGFFCHLFDKQRISENRKFRATRFILHEFLCDIKCPSKFVVTY